MSGARVEYCILGGIEVRHGDAKQASAVTGQPKVAGLLAFLALAPPRRVQMRDRLVGMFWPELDQARARAALRKAVLRISRRNRAEVMPVASSSRMTLMATLRLWRRSRAS